MGTTPGQQGPPARQVRPDGSLAIKTKSYMIQTIFRIYYPDSDYLIDLTESNPANGTPIIMYPTQNPGLNQQWKIEPAQ